MKIQILQMFSALALITSAAAANAQEDVMNNHTANLVEMPADSGLTEAFADFLAAVPLVTETEPGTVLWFALQAQDSLAIFNILVFVDEGAGAGSAYAAEVVAGALSEDANTLFDGGWDAGVVANINNSNLLSAKTPVDLYTATTATYIKLEAAPGQSEQLATLLTAAGSIVAEFEPKTLFWVALQVDETNFAIFGIFADNCGREAHFAGQLAGLLKELSSVLIAGGWDEGVVAKVSNFDILAVN